MLAARNLSHVMDFRLQPDELPPNLLPWLRLALATSPQVTHPPTHPHTHTHTHAHTHAHTHTHTQRMHMQRGWHAPLAFR